MNTVRLAVAIACSAWLGCKSHDDSSGSSAAAGLCGEVTDKFAECGLLASKRDITCIPPRTERDECEAHCILSLKCSALNASFCQDGSFDFEVTNKSELGVCLASCRELVVFACSDGSKPADGAVHCDGERDCSDGSDEKGCKLFACKDGKQSIADALRCDAIRDCSDGSDEAGCGGFKCKDDRHELLVGQRCDGERDCKDGSDEAGCGVLSCG